MVKCLYIAISVVFITISSGYATPPSTQQGNELSIVTAYVEAYNNRDVEAMSKLMHSNIQWLNVEGAKASIMADGKADLVDQMVEYISTPMATRSELSLPIINGQFIAVVEVARWDRDDGSTGKQSALTVYQIEKGLVRRVWYYPAARLDSSTLL